MNNICSMPEIMEAMLILNRVLGILKILIPIVVIITGMYSYFKATLSNGDPDLKASFHLLMAKMMVAASVFFIPTIINSIMKTAFPNSNYTACFSNISRETINKTYLAYAKKTLEKVEKTLEKGDYDEASFYVSKIQNETVRKNYKQRLKTAYDKIVEKTKKELPNDPNIGGIDTDPKPSNPSGGSQGGDISGGNGYTPNVGTSKGYGNLLVGDSRTVGLKNQVSLRSTDHIYATTGGSLNAFNTDVANAISKINSDSSHRYNLVLNYGVNGINQDWVTAYKNVIAKVGNKANILIVSVNPCNDSIARYCRNQNIKVLNNKLKSAFSSGYSNVKYCDTFTPFINTPNYTSMIETKEGIHYTKQGGAFIYSRIQSCLNSF